MKTNSMRIDWLIPFLGVAVVAGSLAVVTTYCNLEQKMRESDAFGATIDRLYLDQKLSAALKAIHEGKVDTAAQSLDLLLCESILQLNGELGSADARTRAYTENAFRRIALLRPQLDSAGAGGSAVECSEDQVAAERILTRALLLAQATQVP